MGKKVFSLCMALALCLSLLPVTALAVEGAPHSLYVGNTSLSLAEDSYWTTDTDGNLTQSAADQSWNVKYDPATVTLTLRGATIQGGLIPDQRLLAPGSMLCAAKVNQLP